MIWCYRFQQYINCTENCCNCNIYSYPQQYYSLPQQYNYKCPTCQGEFNYPSVPSVTSSLYYKCPFCAKLMEGLYQDGFKTEESNG
jgi:DNA-directed RNA polymerase subunit RPC12/RpoP